LLLSRELGFNTFNRGNGGCMHVQIVSIDPQHYMVLKTRKQQPE